MPADKLLCTKMRHCLAKWSVIGQVFSADFSYFTRSGCPAVLLFCKNIYFTSNILLSSVWQPQLHVFQDVAMLERY